MKVLVTGGAGFLGTECVRQLRAASHEVITADKRTAADIVLDFADEAAVRRLPDVDAVIHTAAAQYVTSGAPIIRRRAFFHQHNVVATRHLAARYSGADTHFVNIGSSMMYAQTGRDRYDVRSPMRAQGVYTASKIEALQFVERMPNPTSTIIPCIIAGPGRGGLFASLAGAMRRWHVAPCPGAGTHTIHLVHVRDAASLIVRVVEQRAVGRFNAASPNPLSIQGWIDEMAAEMGMTDLRRITLPLPPIAAACALSGYRLLAREQVLMLRFPHELSVDESLALGWTPTHSNTAIVRDTIRGLGLGA